MSSPHPPESPEPVIEENVCDQLPSPAPFDERNIDEDVEGPSVECAQETMMDEFQMKQLLDEIDIESNPDPRKECPVVIPEGMQEPAIEADNLEDVGEEEEPIREIHKTIIIEPECGRELQAIELYEMESKPDPRKEYPAI
ncbi:uncharacterized protein LOC110247963 [Exaiptasia diaphana]|uniref:Uncharacterized protein n=1 Tax=Exaiptasia diaphana TaxID=2652724 RepID=A0A913XW38_EXADI|nr:uncharacterized protein LOC110247963 [Exaiptasia diaphana]